MSYLNGDRGISCQTSSLSKGWQIHLPALLIDHVSCIWNEWFAKVWPSSSTRTKLKCGHARVQVGLLFLLVELLKCATDNSAEILVHHSALGIKDGHTTGTIGMLCAILRRWFGYFRGRFPIVRRFLIAAFAEPFVTPNFVSGQFA